MKTTKLIAGILMILISIFIVLQSMLAGITNSIENKGNVSGSFGVMIALAYFIAGLVYITTRKMEGLGGDIAGAVILILFGLLGLFGTDNVFADLAVWIWLGIIIGAGFLIWHIIKNRSLSKNQVINNQPRYNPYQQQHSPYEQQNPYNQKQQQQMTRTEMRRNHRK